MAIETHVLYFLKWEVLFFLGALSYMLDFDVKGIIRPLGKFWELFTGNKKLANGMIHCILSQNCLARKCQALEVHPSAIRYLHRRS